ncbi:unnamed protein product [Larinioides sclopetarius]|uniref:Uncharacterized protein n=1 Tax=Larinioides sclopetarius TaxID=280406 RepID=A0AAV1YTM6_9ARAC
MCEHQSPSGLRNRYLLYVNVDENERGNFIFEHCQEVLFSGPSASSIRISGHLVNIANFQRHASTCNG